jgi:hypothetical protein
MEVYPPPTPYQICKIEELRKNSKGGVEVAVKCFYRRRDLPSQLLALADQHALALEEENIDEGYPLASFVEELNNLELHLVKHRELFLSRQIETFKIDMVRGKCTVHLLNELDHLRDYLKKEDFFFYSMVYDPTSRNLMVDKGEIRVGDEYQADVPPMLSQGEEDPKNKTEVEMESQTWEPGQLNDHKVEQYLVMARSVGTFARALLDGSRKPQISLRLGAAAASRDITLFHAMDTLHQNQYDIANSVTQLVPRGPVLCADELEAWTQDEARRFEEGLQEAKDFYYIHKKHLPWKSVNSIVSYYYFWKTTDRYQIQKRHRMIEKQNDLKEVIVHLRSNGPPTAPRDLSGRAATSGVPHTAIPNSMSTGPPPAADGKGCESCYSTTAQRWYFWGPTQEQCRLCNYCMIYWRKYGGLKLPTKWEMSDKSCSFAAVLAKNKEALKSPQAKRHISNKPRKGPTVQPQGSFMCSANGVTHYIRAKLGQGTLKRLARNPFQQLTITDLPTVEEALFDSKKSSVRVGGPVSSASSGELENVVSHLRSAPLPSPRKTLIKTPTPISPLPTSLRKASIFPQPTQPPAAANKPKEIKGKLPSTEGSNGVVEKDVGNMRKRKADMMGESPLHKMRRNANSEGPETDYFLKADDSLRKMRMEIAKKELLKAARSPNKTNLSDRK